MEDKHLKKWVFSLRRNIVIFHTDLTLTENEFHTVGAAIEEVQIPNFAVIKSTL